LRPRHVQGCDVGLLQVCEVISSSVGLVPTNDLVFTNITSTPSRRQPGSDPKESREERVLPQQSNSVKTFVMARAAPVRQRQASRNLSIRMVAGFAEVIEREETFGCVGSI
jgi:hypothetical protein